MKISTSDATYGIHNISVEKKGAQIALRWNCAQQYDAFLVFIRYGEALMKSQSVDDLIMQMDMPPENDWIPGENCKAYQLTANAYKAQKGFSLQRSALPSNPAELSVFFIVDGEICFPGYQIPLKKPIAYTIKSGFTLPFLNKRRYTIMIRSEDQAIMDGFILCKVGKSTFPLSARNTDEPIEVIADKHSEVRLVLTEIAKQFYSIKEDDGR